MKLISTTLYSGLITFVKTAAGFISTKVVAMLIGTSGVAAIGAFSNFVNIVLTFANGAINNGIVKYSAEYNGDPEQENRLYNNSFLISLLCSSLVSVILIVFSKYFSNAIFKVDDYAYVIKVLGFTIVFYSLNSLLISFLNGIGKIKLFTIVNLIGSLVALCSTCIMVYFYKIEGALLAMILTQTMIFFITVIFLWKKRIIINQYKFNFKLDKDLCFKLGQFSLMAIVSAITVPLAQIVVRNYIIESKGIDAAGFWQGMMRISDAYLLIVITSLRTYYLPKISALKTNEEIFKEIKSGYKLIMPVLLLGFVFVYFLRFFIIKLLYTPTFIEMEKLFLWQMIGDFFKIAAFILAFVLLAKSLTKMYIIGEVIFSITYILLCFYLVPLLDIKGATIASSINYFGYFVFLLICLRLFFLKKRINND